MKKISKIVSALLVLLMIMSVAPLTVFAASEAIVLKYSLTDHAPVTYRSNVTQYYQYNKYLYKVTYTNMRNVKEVYLHHDNFNRLNLHYRATDTGGLYYFALLDSNKETAYTSDLPKTSGSKVSFYTKYDDVASNVNSAIVTITCSPVKTPVWTWNGKSSATVKFTSTDGNAYVNVTAYATKKVTNTPNCQTREQLSYTVSTTFNGQTYSDTKTETGNFGSHSYKDKKCKYCGNICYHNNTLVSVDAKAPTCTGYGWDAYKYCTACDYTSYVKLPADPDAHNIVVDEAVAPDCYNSGLTAGQHCSRCDEASIAQEIIPALNHKDTLVQVDAKAPTCTGIGWDVYEYCTACDYTTYAEKAALEHDIVTDEAVAPDCYNSGLTAGQHCSGCDEASIAQEIVPALNHKDTLVQVDAKAPTCTGIGWDAYEYCTACDYTTYAEKAALEHDIVTDEAVAPDCYNSGLTAGQHCSRCDEASIAQEIIPALNHKDTLVHVDAKAPTCTGIGWDAYEYCTECDFTTYKEISAKSHKYNAVVTAPTCTEKGYTTYICACGDNYISDYSDVIAHSYKSEVTTTATHLKEGVLTYTCERCNAVCTEAIAKTEEHTYTAAVTAPATYLNEGVMTYSCACGHKYTTAIEKLVATFTDSEKAFADGDGIFMTHNVTVGELLTQGSEGSVISDSNGKTVASDMLVGTGMIFVLPDGEKKNIVVSGDVDGNGKITAADARLALRAAAQLENYPEDSCYYKAADVVGADSRITASDARRILRAAAGLEKPAIRVEKTK